MSKPEPLAFVRRDFFTSLHAIPKTVWGISIAGFLMNASTIIVFSYSPLYLGIAFGMTAAGIGLLEAVVECISWLMRVVSGLLSDFFRKRKVFILISYSLSALVRPIFPLATSSIWIFFGRALDRIANGLQATPREALIADISPPGLKGACFGLRQALGTAGSAVGGLVGVIVMAKTGNYQLVFWIATIPALLGVALLVFMMEDNRFTEEKVRSQEKSTLRALFNLEAIKSFPAIFWLAVGLTVVLLLGRYSGAFIILFAKQVGMADFYAPTVTIVYNVVSALTAYPLGLLSDKMNRRFSFGLGFAMMIIADLFFALSTNVGWFFVGVVAWGIKFGIVQSIPMAMIADASPKHLRGTAFGIFYLASGVALFVASWTMGWVADSYTPRIAFLASAGMVVLGLVVIFAILKLKSFFDQKRGCQ